MCHLWFEGGCSDTLWPCIVCTSSRGVAISMSTLLKSVPATVALHKRLPRRLVPGSRSLRARWLWAASSLVGLSITAAGPCCLRPASALMHRSIPVCGLNRQSPPGSRAAAFQPAIPVACRINVFAVCRCQEAHQGAERRESCHCPWVRWHTCPFHPVHTASHTAEWKSELRSHSHVYSPAACQRACRIPGTR